MQGTREVVGKECVVEMVGLACRCSIATDYLSAHRSVQRVLLILVVKEPLGEDALYTCVSFDNRIPGLLWCGRLKYSKISEKGSKKSPGGDSNARSQDNFV